LGFTKSRCAELYAALRGANLWVEGARNAASMETPYVCDLPPL